MRFVKEYLILLLLLFCVSVITFYEVFTGIKIFVSGDSLSPISIREGINNIINLSGEYPYWLPWIFSGMPSIHSFTNISDFYYPHKLFLFLNSIGLPWIWNFLLHLIFGGCGMYSLTRYLSCSRYSSLFASICFITLPYLVAMIAFGHGSQAMTAAYIPIIILFLFKVFDKTNILNLSVFSVLLGLQLQRGHVQICYYTWMMIGLYILIKNSYFFYNELLSKTEILKKNIYVFCSLLIGFLISINIYFPVFNYVNSSIRSEGGSGGGLMYATQWSFSIKEMVTLFIPSFLGFGGKLYWGNFPFTDYPNYFGFILFVLAVIGFFKSTFSKENKFFLLSVLIFSILISFGKNFLFFYKIFYYYLPFFDKFRVPVYILILTFFILLIFASSGLKTLYLFLVLLFYFYLFFYLYIIYLSLHLSNQFNYKI